MANRASTQNHRRKVVSKCGTCGKKLRLPVKPGLKVRCPACGTVKVQFECGACGKTIRAKVDWGAEIRCPSCRKVTNAQRSRPQDRLDRKALGSFAHARGLLVADVLPVVTRLWPSRSWSHESVLSEADARLLAEELQAIDKPLKSKSRDSRRSNGAQGRHLLESFARARGLLLADVLPVVKRLWPSRSWSGTSVLSDVDVRLLAEEIQAIDEWSRSKSRRSKRSTKRTTLEDEKVFFSAKSKRYHSDDRCPSLHRLRIHPVLGVRRRDAPSKLTGCMQCVQKVCVSCARGFHRCNPSAAGITFCVCPKCRFK